MNLPRLLDGVPCRRRLLVCSQRGRRLRRCPPPGAQGIQSEPGSPSGCFMAQNRRGSDNQLDHPSLSTNASSLVHTSLIWLLTRLTTSGVASLGFAATAHRIPSACNANARTWNVSLAGHHASPQVCHIARIRKTRNLARSSGNRDARVDSRGRCGSTGTSIRGLSSDPALGGIRTRGRSFRPSAARRCASRVGPWRLEARIIQPPIAVGPLERFIGFCEILRGRAGRIARHRIGPRIQ